MPANQKSIYHKIGFGIGVCLLILLGMAQLFKRDLLRFQATLTLFEPGGIVENFRGMTRIYDFRTVHRSGPVFRIVYESERLPERYAFGGSSHDLRQWIERTMTSGLIIIHDGKIAFERYYRGNRADTHWISWSICRPVVAALVGCAMEDGLIRSLSDPVTDYVPRLETTAYHKATVEQLLRFTTQSGLDARESGPLLALTGLGRILALGEALDEAALSSQRFQAPTGGMAIHVLGMVLRKATGRSLSAYMEEKLWSRMGAEADAQWLVDGAGVELACCGLNAVLRDYARFGLLFLGGGKTFRGQQILPGRWTEESVNPGRDGRRMPEVGGDTAYGGVENGFQWRLSVPRSADYWVVGRFGQFIYVHPGYRVVIAKTSADHRSGPAMEQEALAVFRSIAAHLGRRF